MRKWLVFLIALFLSGCVGKNLNKPLETKLKDEIYADFNASSSWWEKYKNTNLNAAVESLLKQNKDIQIAKLNHLSALTRYDLLNLDMYPTLSGQIGANIRKNLHSKSEDHGFSNGISLSYELDLFGKIRNRIQSGENMANASFYEWQELKLDTLNIAINSIFDLVFFNDVDKLLNERLNNLQTLKEIYDAKYSYGKLEFIDILQLKKSIFSTQQNIITNLQNRNQTYTNLKNMTKNEEALQELLKHSIDDFSLPNLNFDIDLSMLSHKSSIKAKLSKLKASFYDYKALQKGLIPSVKIGSSLNGSDERFEGSFKFLTLGGNISIDLAFLDFPRVQKNVKISQIEYEKKLLEYKNAYETAVNDFMLLQKNHDFYHEMLKIVKITSENQRKIKQIYFEKYELGRSELKDYLDADALLISSNQELLRAKLALLKNANLYHNVVLVER